MRGIENGNDGSTIFEKKIFAAFKMQIASLSLVCHLTPKLHQMFKLNLCLYFYSLIGLYFCSVCNDHVDCSEITQLFLRGKVDEKNSQSFWPFKKSVPSGIDTTDLVDASCPDRRKSQIAGCKDYIWGRTRTGHS